MKKESKTKAELIKELEQTKNELAILKEFKSRKKKKDLGYIYVCNNWSYTIRKVKVLYARKNRVKIEGYPPFENYLIDSTYGYYTTLEKAIEHREKSIKDKLKSLDTETKKLTAMLRNLDEYEENIRKEFRGQNETENQI